MDRVSPEQRSRIMSSIRSRDTKLEMLVRRALHAAGLRFRVHAKLPGSPDIVFGPCRLAVFMNVSGDTTGLVPVEESEPPRPPR